MSDLSIIIPTKNRPEILVTTLNHALIAIQDTTIDVIVVNDGNEIINKINHCQITYYNNPKQGVTTARNFGAQLAKSNYLLFLDDDMWITKETINILLELIKIDFFKQNTLCLNWEFPTSLYKTYQKNKIGRFYISNNYHNLLGRSGLKEIPNTEIVDSKGIGSASFAISKTIFNLIGKYNEEVKFQGEDIEIYNKLKNNNINTKLLTKFTCYHNDNTISNINDYIKRQFLGYKSQAVAEKNNLISNQFPDRFSIKNKIYTFLLPIEPILIKLFNLIPNAKIFDGLSFKIIGLLGAFQKIKTYKN